MKPTNDSWWVDETYIKVKGEDKYLYRALDSQGNANPLYPRNGTAIRREAEPHRLLPPEGGQMLLRLTVRRTLKGYEAMNMLRKGQVVGVEKGDVLACTEFVSKVFGVAAQ